MIYIIAKQNAGTPRTFKTREGLERALRRAGAELVSFYNGKIIVGWSVEDQNAPALQVEYAVDAEGNTRRNSGNSTPHGRKFRSHRRVRRL